EAIDVVGKSREEAESLLSAEGFVVVIESEVYSDAVPVGVVLSQGLDPGTSRRWGASIGLILSKGHRLDQTVPEASIVQRADTIPEKARDWAERVSAPGREALPAASDGNRMTSRAARRSVVIVGAVVGLATIAILLVLPRLRFSYSVGRSWPDHLYKVLVGEKYGFIDSSGVTVIPPKYNACKDFSEGLAAAWVQDGVGYIDRSGRFVIGPSDSFTSGCSFSEGVAFVQHWAFFIGAIDRNGEWLCRDTFWELPLSYLILSYERAEVRFSSGLAPVSFAREGGKCGYVDRRFRPAFQGRRWAGVGCFSDGLAAVADEEPSTGKILCGYIDTRGRYAIPPQFERVSDFDCGRALVWQDSRPKYIDRSGGVCIRTDEFQDCLPFSDGLAWVRVDGKWGCIDTSGSMALSAEYDVPGYFRNGLCLVSKGTDTGYVDKTGKLVWRMPSGGTRPSEVMPKQEPSADRPKSGVSPRGLEQERSTPMPSTKSTEENDIPVVPFMKVEVKPQPMHIPVPEYPEDARTARVEGQAVVEALVDADGSIADARILKSSGNAALDRAATDAAMRATFTPASHKGVAARVWVVIPFRFTLD
ncbi:MAG: TonB family protein, partial [Armatimonadetes bacterium]|nr:TonB family protein [Armatimonadota bacterium]